MLAVLLALSAPDLPVAFEAARAELRRVQPPPIQELLDAIRAAQSPSEQAKLLDRLVGRCGGLSSADAALVVMSLEGLPGRPRTDLGRCAFWFRDVSAYDRALRALLDRPDAHSLFGLHEASKRLHVASPRAADEVYDGAMETARLTTKPQEKFLALRILYNVLTIRGGRMVDGRFEDLVFAPFEAEPREIRWATMWLIRAGWPRHPDTLRVRLRARDLFDRLRFEEPDAQLRQLAERFYLEIRA